MGEPLADQGLPATTWLPTGGRRLLFDGFAHKSEAKDADRRAVDTAEHRPEVLDDESVPAGQRVLAAERHRLGLDG